MTGQTLETHRERLLLGNALFELFEMQRDDPLGRHLPTAQQMPDLLQWESHGAQRLDLLQALDVVGVVQSMAGRRAGRRREQPISS